MAAMASASDAATTPSITSPSSSVSRRRGTTSRT